MRLAGRELALRLESEEAAISEACVEAVLNSRPASGAMVQPVAGGQAFFFGPQSPLSQAVGIGMQGPVLDEEFARLEGFFLSRGAPVAISLCPYADPSLLECIAKGRYRIAQFEHTLLRELDGNESLSAPGRDTVRAAAADEARLWARTVMAGFLDGAPAIPEMEELFATMQAAPRATAYLAWQGGEPAGGATLSIRGDAAFFAGDSTLPQFRGRGVQTGLIAARLQKVSAAGCRLAIACTGAGTISQRNYERAGFRVVYTKAILVKDGYA